MASYQIKIEGAGSWGGFKRSIFPLPIAPKWPPLLSVGIFPLEELNCQLRVVLTSRSGTNALHLSSLYFQIIRIQLFHSSSAWQRKKIPVTANNLLRKRNFFFFLIPFPLFASPSDLPRPPCQTLPLCGITLDPPYGGWICQKPRFCPLPLRKERRADGGGKPSISGPALLSPMPGATPRVSLSLSVACTYCTCPYVREY